MMRTTTFLGRPRASLRLAWIALVVALALVTGCAAPSSPHFFLADREQRLSLEGAWRFQEGDDARWAEPAFDDAAWRSIQIPGIWRFQGVKTDDFGWYRQSFDVAPELEGQDLGLEVPYTYYAYEVFVNGTKLEGRYSAPSRRGAMPAGGVNVFRVPHGALHRTGNVIALRTQGGMGYGGVYRDGMSIGTFGVISRALDREIVVQLGVSAVCFFIGIYHLLIFLNRRENRLAYLTYSLYAIILAIFLPAYAGFWYVVFPSHWFNTLAEFGTFAASIPFIPIFIHALFDVPQNRITRAGTIFTIVNLVWLLGEAAIRGTISAFLVYFPMVVVGFTVSFVYSLSIVVRAARQRKPDAWLMLCGFIFYLVCTTNDVARYFVLLPGGTRLGHWGFLGFCVAIAIGIGNQYSRMTHHLAELRVGLEEEVERQTKELREKNSQLSEQAAELRSLDELKRRFYTNVSHELRTPLTLILGFLRRLSARVAGDASAERDMEAAERNAAHLLREINDLLDVARLEAGSMTVRAAPVDLAALAKEVASNFAPAGEAAGSGRKLVVEAAPVIVYLDFDKVRKIVFNLLSNAFKFTHDETGVVTLTVREEDDGVLLEVKDNGIGIRADQLAHVFERFRQADGSTTRKYEGTGIGLALVKEIAELHGAIASVASEVGKGSSFRVRFKKGRAHLRDEDVSETVEPALEQKSGEPDALSDLQRLAAQSSDAPSTRPEIVATDGGPEILVVEDHRDLRAYMVSLLGSRYGVRSAGDGKEALARIEASMPALVVSDVMMPNMDGYELCAALKSNPRTRHIPVVLLTAQSGLDAKVRGLEAQADDYLTKPFHEEELFARVKNLLLLAERTNELREINKKLEVRVLEQADALQRRGRLRRFLPPAIADELLAEDAGAALEKKRRLVAVLAAEICDFEDLAAAIEPEDVTVLFGRFHALTTAAVFKNGGTIVALHNGSLVAVFGAPKELGEQEAAEAGFRAARELSDALGELDLAMRDLAADRSIVLRGGLDVGHATVGAFGDNEWASFAAIGGPSARAPRLSALAAPGEIVLTRRLASHLGDASASLVGPETVHLEETSQLIFRWRNEKRRQSAPTVRRANPEAMTVQAISVRPNDATRPVGTAANGGGDTMRSLLPKAPTNGDKRVAVTSGRTLGGRYKIEEQLGRGGMGAVFAASDLLLGERVAIKVLHDDDQDADDAKRRLERLRHEVRLARIVTHPNVCRVFDLQVLDGHACLTMELLRGRSLRELLDQGPVATPRAIGWTRQICDALGAAHACGIVHRDLKPDNVMVDLGVAAHASDVSARASERVVITDFGIARPLPQPDTAETDSTTQKSPELRPALEGTLDYIAPEQLDPAMTPDHRADIYSLGVVLYELFTGALPFDDKQALARLRARLVREPRDPAAIVPSIDPTVRAVLLRCLRRDTSERFQRVADIALALGDRA